MSKPLFDVTLRVNAEEMSELVIDWATWIHKIEAVQAPIKAPRRRTNHSNPGTYSSASDRLKTVKSYDGDAKTSQLAWNIINANQGKKGLVRSEAVNFVKALFKRNGYAETGASSAITSLIRDGYLKSEKSE